MGISPAVTATAIAIPEGTVALGGRSDFQILAQFAQRPAAGDPAHVGGRPAEFAAKGVGKVAVAGEAQIESERREILRSLHHELERGAKAQSRQIAVERAPGS